MSDKYLTENCGVLNKLLPGDIVLADRGFDIADSVSAFQARLHIPAFIRGKDQLSAAEVEETRSLANVRIATCRKSDWCSMPKVLHFTGNTSH